MEKKEVARVAKSRVYKSLEEAVHVKNESAKRVLEKVDLNKLKTLLEQNKSSVVTP